MQETEKNTEALPRSYCYDLQVDFHDTDSDGILRPSAAFRYMQSAADLQMHTCGPSNEELRKKGQAFVVTRFAVNFAAPIFAYEDIHVESRALESRGVTFGRYYCLMRRGVTVAEAQSVCALLDIGSGRPLPVSSFHPGFANGDMPEHPLTLRFALPAIEEFSEVGTYCVTYGDTDFNKHMNNTRYPDMLANFLPMDGMRFASVILNFQKEAPRDTVLRILHAEKAGIHYFRTLRPDGSVNVEASVKLTEI